MELAPFFKDAPAGAEKLAVVGCPLGHTLSPAMHNAAFKALGLDAVYRAAEVRPEAWDDFLEQAAALPLKGFNVTLPFKGRMAAVAREKDFFVAFTEAANTAARRPGGWRADNTDGDGFVEDLRAHGIDLAGRSVMLVGAGGSARAILGAVYKEGLSPGLVTVVNRGQERARAMVDNFRATLGPEHKEEWRRASLSKNPVPFPVNLAETALDRQKALGDADVLINASSLGLAPGDEPPVDLVALRPEMAVYDLIYHRETELLRAARSAGARAVGGLGMLVRQGARSFEIWFGRPAPVDAMRAAAERELAKRTTAKG